MIIPVGSISKLTGHALHAALSLIDDVAAVSGRPEAARSAAFRAGWDRWNPGVRLDTLDSPHRSPARPARRPAGRCPDPRDQPRRRRYRILQNQPGLLLATVLRASTGAVTCTIPDKLSMR